MRNNCRVVLTDKCNLDCSFCCMKKKETFYSFKNQTALWIAKQRYDEIGITGGEPLVEFERLVQFICLLKYFNKDAKIYLYTNGSLLHTETAATLKIAGLNGINWSPKHKPRKYGTELSQMSFIHADLIPIRILIQNDLPDKDLLRYAANNGMETHIWTIGDCYNMETEDRFRIDWSSV